MRVLVIDDERPILKSTARLLGRAHEVVTAESAEEALARLAEDTFDAILCDLHLHGMDGFELVAALPPATAARVLFMTGGVWEKSDEELLKGRKVIEKPFTPEELLAALEQVGAPSAAPPAEGAVVVHPR